MSQEEQDANIGRAITARNRARIKVAQLTTKAEDTAKKFRQLADLLEENPELVWFNVGSMNTKYFDDKRAPTFAVGDFDGKMVAGLTTDIRNALDELRRCEEKAASLGC